MIEHTESEVIDTSSVPRLVDEWNKLNRKYQAMQENWDIMRLGEQNQIARRMALIQSACVTIHMMSEPVRSIHGREDIERISLPFLNKDLRSSLQSYDDIALICLKNRLSEMIQKDDRRITDLYLEKTSEYLDGLSQEDRDGISVYESKQVIPFLSAFYEIAITDALGVSYNVYVAQNIRDLFVVPIQCSFKQNHGIDVDTSDAEILIKNFCETLRDDIRGYFREDDKPMAATLYALGMNECSGITEKLCQDLDEAFSYFVREKRQIIPRLLSGDEA